MMQQQQQYLYVKTITFLGYLLHDIREKNGASLVLRLLLRPAMIVLPSTRSAFVAFSISRRESRDYADADDDDAAPRKEGVEI